MPYETNDHFGWWDPSNPQGGLLVADRKLQEAGILGDNSFYAYAGGRTPHDASKNVWAPRFGFALRPFGQGKTVVRGGYGIFFDSSEEREIDGSADIYPYVSRGVYVQSSGQPLLLRRSTNFFPTFVPRVPATPQPTRSWQATPVQPQAKILIAQTAWSRSRFSERSVTTQRLS